eukprot:41898_1
MMEHLIRFRMLANQLDDKEFDEFIIRLIASKGRLLLLTCLFNHYLSNRNQIIGLTNIISSIIKDREKDNKCVNKSINKLPVALIAETASYLKASEYIIFSRSSRKIYVSCNSPCKIYHVPTCLLKKYPENSSMNKFKSLKQLGLNIKYFNNKISFSNQSTWRNVKLDTLQLSNRGGNENDLLTFIERNCINYTKNLKLHKFGRDLEHKYDCKSFCKLLSHFNMIENLLLWDCFLTDDNIDNIEEFNGLKHLKGFGFTGGYNQKLSQYIIKSLSLQLEALRIEGLNYRNISNIAFPNLKELSLSMCNLEVLQVFKKTNTLNSVMISSSKEDILLEFIKIMINKKYIKHIHIKSPAKMLKYAMEQTENMLFNTKFMYRPNKALQIIFDGNNWDNEQILLTQLNLTIFRLINALIASNIQDFILRVKITSKIKEINQKKK